MKGLIIIMCLLLSRNAVFSLDERKNLAIHVFPFAKCEKDSVEAICASWLEPVSYTHLTLPTSDLV